MIGGLRVSPGIGVSISNIIHDSISKEAQAWGDNPVYSDRLLLYVLQILYKLKFDISSRDAVIPLLEVHRNPRLVQHVSENMSDEQYGKLAAQAAGLGTDVNSLGQTRQRSWDEWQQQPPPQGPEVIPEQAPISDEEALKLVQQTRSRDVDRAHNEAIQSQQLWEKEKLTPSTADIRARAEHEIEQAYARDPQALEVIKRTKPDVYESLVQYQIMRINQFASGRPGRTDQPHVQDIGSIEPPERKGALDLEAQVEDLKLKQLYQWLGWLAEAGFDLSELQFAQSLAARSGWIGAYLVQQMTPEQYEALWQSGVIQQFMASEQKELGQAQEQAEQLRDQQQPQAPPQPVQPLPRQHDPNIITVRELNPLILQELIPRMLTIYRLNWIIKRDQQGNIVTDREGNYVTDPDRFKAFAEHVRKNRRDTVFVREDLSDEYIASGQLPRPDPEAIANQTKLFMDQLGHDEFRNPIFRSLAEKVDHALQTLQANRSTFKVPNQPIKAEDGSVKNPEDIASDHADKILEQALNSADQFPADWERKEQKAPVKQRYTIDEADDMAWVNTQMENLARTKGLKTIDQNFDPNRPHQYETPPIMAGFYFGKPLYYYIKIGGRETGVKQVPIQVFYSKKATKTALRPWHRTVMADTYVGKGIFVHGSKGFLGQPQSGNMYPGMAYIVGVEGGEAVLQPEAARGRNDPPPRLLVWNPNYGNIFAVQPGVIHGLYNAENDAYLSNVDTGDNDPRSMSRFQGYGSELCTKALRAEKATVENVDKQGSLVTIADIVRRVMTAQSINPPTPLQGQPSQPANTPADIPRTQDGQPAAPGDVIRPPSAGVGGDPAAQGRIDEITPGGDVIMTNDLGNKVVQPKNTPAEVIKQALSNINF